MPPSPFPSIYRKVSRKKGQEKKKEPCKKSLICILQIDRWSDRERQRQEGEKRRKMDRQIEVHLLFPS